MKFKILVILLLLSSSVYSQDVLFFQAPPGATITMKRAQPKISFTGYSWKKPLVSFALGTKRGMWNALHETLSYHYDVFQEVHPKANPNFWDPNRSWKNKWLNGDKSNGPKYLFSNNILVWTTDGIHIIKTKRFLSDLELGCSITIGEKMIWWHYVLNAAAGFVGNNLGFALIYKGIYRNR